VPELPDLEVYLDRLRPRIGGRVLARIRLASPFVLRTVDPPVADLEGRRVVGLRRLGKRIVLAFEGDRFAIVHLRIAGRLRWADPGAALNRKLALAAFEFESGTLVLTEAGTKRRASIHLARGEGDLAAHDPGGIEPLEADPAAFADAIRRESRTLKRALTDPRILSGIGNAYSDEILHAARLSPVRRTRSLDDGEIERLYRATRATLSDWTARLLADRPDRFPDKVTAFREGMAVHGRYRAPCPVCAAPVQRIRYADNECNYCARCQNGGRILADRALSRLLGADWPRTLDDLEDWRSRDSIS